MRNIGQGLATVLLLICVSMESATAGSLSERFKEWLIAPATYTPRFHDKAAGLDDVATGCIRCHNGITATHVTIKDAEAPLQFEGFVNVNHPVGMRYDDYASRKPRDYLPRMSLDPNIRLVDGQVSCVSCHRLKSDKEQGDRAFIKASLVEEANAMCTGSITMTVGPRETDLCLSCHIK